MLQRQLSRTTVRLTTAKFKPLILSVCSFTLFWVLSHFTTDRQTDRQTVSQSVCLSWPWAPMWLLTRF